MSPPRGLNGQAGEVGGVERVRRRATPLRALARLQGGGLGGGAGEDVGPGTAGLPTGTEYSRVGSNTWICPSSIVPTRIGVELVGVLGNQPNSSD